MFIIFKKSFNLELTKQSLVYVELKLLLIRKVDNENSGIPMSVEP